MTTTASAVQLGAEVLGTGGKLGEVSRLIVNARIDQATDLVVKHGFLFGRERVVPLSHVTRVAEGRVYLDLDKHGLEQMNGFTEDAVQGPDPDYVGPPDADQDGVRRGNFALDATWAAGSAAGHGASGKPLGYPGGEQLAPDLMFRPAIWAGIDVLDPNGEKVGEVGDFAVTPDTGRPVSLTVRRGLLFTRDTEVPVAWVQNLTNKGIVLDVTKDRVEALRERARERGPTGG